MTKQPDKPMEKELKEKISSILIDYDIWKVTRDQRGLPFPNTVDELLKVIKEAIQATREETINEMVDLSDKLETGYTTLEEWKAFKHFRNTMRDSLTNKSEK